MRGHLQPHARALAHRALASLVQVQGQPHIVLSVQTLVLRPEAQLRHGVGARGHRLLSTRDNPL